GNERKKWIEIEIRNVEGRIDEWSLAGIAISDLTAKLRRSELPRISRLDIRKDIFTGGKSKRGLRRKGISSRARLNGIARDALRIGNPSLKALKVRTIEAGLSV